MRMGSVKGKVQKTHTELTPGFQTRVGPVYTATIPVAETMVLRAITSATEIMSVCLEDYYNPCHNPQGFPGGVVGKEPACQCRRCKRHGFNPWFGKIPWRRNWQPTPVFLPG